MNKKRPFSEIKKEIEDQYYEKYVKPFEEGQLQFEELQKRILENPSDILKDPKVIELSAVMKTYYSIKGKLENSIRNLLFANAGGAILIINLMPSIVENEKLFPLAANALTNFSYGLVLLLISAILVFISDWSSFVKDLFKVINISEWKILKIDYSFYAIFLSGICSIASLYLFVSAILSTTFAINNLVQ